ncbi:MAG TPA: FMN-binding negative transcriptional regulator [Rhizomicrobium sp.]|jgi:transcriptional regulator|nr:FMN-binding negative transcriptional regulator [Rhizomicrobium sp.]
MYRPVAYAIDTAELLHAVMRKRSFATVAAVIEDKLRFAYAPVVVDAEPRPFGAVRFHLARANPMSGVDETPVLLSFLAADAYVSPDWYETKGFVPTWNYIAVEAEGRARALDESELRQLLIVLSAAAEEPLRPKLPWTIDKVPEERRTMLLNRIRGFHVVLERLEGKFKLSQDKKPADTAAVISALEARGDEASRAIAHAMRTSQVS